MLSCVLGVTVQIYMRVKSVFAGLASGASRRKPAASKCSPQKFFEWCSFESS